MTVSSSTDRATFPGNGVTTVFPLPFRFLANTDVQAWLIDSATGELSPLSIGIHYTLVGAGQPEQDGAAVSQLKMLIAPDAGQSLFVQRIMEALQPTDIVNQGRFFPEVHELVFDRLTMLAQQNAGEISRAVRVSDSDPVPARLPPADVRAGKLLSFDDLGNPIALAARSESATDLELRLSSRFGPGMGAAMVGYRGRDVYQRLSDSLSVLDFGAEADGVSDDSEACQAMIGATNTLVVPIGRTVVAKNIELMESTSVVILGTLKLPDACADFDRLLFAEGKSGINIYANEIDGNYSGQSANIATHLIYLKECDYPNIHVDYSHDHYIAMGAPMPSVDGTRDTSSGGILVYSSFGAVVRVNRFDGWGREGIYLQKCVNSELSVGSMLGKYDTEYSGVQVSGRNNRLKGATVRNAGASAVGFDVIDGTISDIVALNTRENGGVNFGHIGFPSNGTVASNIVVDGARRFGISVGAGSEDVTISNVSIKNCGESGINFSDGAVRGRVIGGNIGFCGLSALNAFLTSVEVTNVRVDDVYGSSLVLGAVSGSFLPGDVVTTGSGVGTLSAVLPNLDGSILQLMFLSNVPGGATVGSTVTSSSGGEATITSKTTPVKITESGGGLIVFESELTETSAGTQSRLSSGIAEYRRTFRVNYTGSGVSQSFTFDYPAGVTWVASPLPSVSLVGPLSTNTFDINKLSVTSTATTVTVSISATANQEYDLAIGAFGKWR